MELTVVRIGNSRGVRLPAKLLERFHITDKVEVIEDGSRLIIRAVVPRKSRVGWARAFRKMASSGDDRLFIDATLDIDEDWKW